MWASGAVPVFLTVNKTLASRWDVAGVRWTLRFQLVKVRELRSASVGRMSSVGWGPEFGFEDEEASWLDG